MSKSNHFENVRRERSLFEKISSYIPGYKGYKEKELRRESDRLVRMEIVNRLKTAKTAFRRTFANPMFVQKLSGEDTYRFEAFNSRLDRVTQRIDRAVAGYAGMFSAIKVKEDKLDAVIQHDFGLIERADSIKTDVEKTVKIEPATEEWRRAMDMLISKIEDLDSLVNERSNILRGLEG